MAFRPTALWYADGVYRLTSFERGSLNANKDDIVTPDRSQTWTLDWLGNWDQTVVDGTTETRTHNSINELTQTSVGGQQTDLAYDDAGNLTQDGSTDGSHQYIWDYRNRLIEVRERQGGEWVTVGSYKYDARNRRVAKTTYQPGNSTTRFLWGGDGDWQCLEERDSSGDLVARYTHAPTYIDAVAVQERDLNDDQDFLDANEVVYYHANTLASVMALTDASENVVERYRYAAYGAVTVLDADDSADADGLSDVLNPYTFTARRLDLESGLMQYRNRCLDTGLGRFISRDPAGYIDGYSLYAYASARPRLGVDPTGLRIVDEPPEGYFGYRHTGPGRAGIARLLAGLPEQVPERAKEMIECVLESISCEVWDKLGGRGTWRSVEDAVMTGETCGQKCGNGGGKCIPRRGSPGFNAGNALNSVDPSGTTVMVNAGLGPLTATSTWPGSLFYANFHVDSSGTWDGCCTVGFVQIADTHIQRRWPYPPDPNPWHLDGGMPYRGEFFDATKTRMAKLRDDPDYSQGWYWLRSYRQDSESCLVCFDKGACGRVIGCINWGHRFDRYGGTRTAYRRVGEQSDMGPVPGPSVYQPKMPACTESGIFRTVAGPHIKAYCASHP